VNAARLLLVEDDKDLRFSVRRFFTSKGYEVSEAGSLAEARAASNASALDVAVIDHSLPDGNALELLSALRDGVDGPPVIVLTGHGSIDLAVAALKEGAEHFLTKPVELPTLQVIVERALENHRNRRKALAQRSATAEPPDPFVGTSAAVRRLSEHVRPLVEADASVLLLGETGTGKGVLAAWLHRSGPRAHEPFVSVNCAALSPELLENELFGHDRGAFTGAVSAKQGLLEVGHRGTVFLDEIGDVNPAVQAKLLTVLEEKRFRRLGDVRDRHVDVRLITATHRDLATLVQENRFRSDLYYRIAALPVALPALRERREDVLPLARAILRRSRANAELSAEAVAALELHPWPGNVRELRNVLERALLYSRSGEIGRQHLMFDPPLAPRASSAAGAEITDGLTLSEMERRLIDRAMELEGGRVEQAARRLGIARSSLYDKLKKHRLKGP
jgi:DNA-binding NtrC family response regulator